jgi:transposase
MLFPPEIPNCRTTRWLAHSIWSAQYWEGDEDRAAEFWNEALGLRGSPDWKRRIRESLDLAARVAQVARDLGINENLIHSWKRKFLENGELSESSQLTPDQKEIRRLRLERERVRQEREILRKAAAYFAKESR